MLSESADGEIEGDGPDVVRPIQIGDVTFLVKFTWGDLKKIGNEIKGLDRSNSEALLDLLSKMEKSLLNWVIGIEGLDGANGQPIKKLTQKVIASAVPATEASTGKIWTLPGRIKEGPSLGAAWQLSRLAMALSGSRALLKN